ncbi:uncharacterized protein TM35_000084440, partial [Trypanosoma theileri]
MSMMPCRVLCLFILLLCCVGVAHADDAHVDDMKQITELAKEAQRLDVEANNLANETLKAVQNCTAAENSVDEAIGEAETSAREILELIKSDRGNAEEMEKKKAEGLRIVKKTKEVVATSREVIKKTKEIKENTVVKGYAALQASEKFYKLYDELKKRYSQPNENDRTKLDELKKIEAEYPMYTNKEMKSAGQHAIDVSHDAIGETLSLQLALTTAENAANQLENAIQHLEAAVTTAETEKLQTGQHGRNQVESQAQPQMQETTVANPHPNGVDEAGGEQDNRESSGTAQTNGNQNVNGEENMSEKDQENERKAQTLNTTAMQNPQQPSGGSETMGEHHTQKKDNTEDKRKKRNVKETPSPPP